MYAAKLSPKLWTLENIGKRARIVEGRQDFQFLMLMLQRLGTRKLLRLLEEVNALDDFLFIEFDGKHQKTFDTRNDAKTVQMWTDDDI